jgi:CubicO group peptidase (beta-lactamase class C family)
VPALPVPALAAPPLHLDSFDPVFDAVAADVASGRLTLAALAIGDAHGHSRKATFSGFGERPVSEDGLFFLASVTKAIFATALMQLVEDGTLVLDRPVVEWVPEFSGGGKDAVTIAHLLTHTSGVGDIEPDVLRRMRPSGARMTQLAISAPLRFLPGSRWDYCSSSFYLLAEIVRRATGLAGTDFLRQRLLDPLGMNDTTYDARRSQRPLVPVRGVGAENRVRRFLLLRYMASIAHPGGGLFATLDDVLCFGAALLQPVQRDGRWLPISADTFALMGQDRVGGLVGNYDGEERAVHQGLGWAKPTLMKDVPGSARVVDHGGATGTRLWIDPDAGLVFVFFTNQWDPDRGPELDALRATYRILG